MFISVPSPDERSPASAHCPPSFYLDNNSLQSICTIMQYWLQVGMIIFGNGNWLREARCIPDTTAGNAIDVLGLNVEVHECNAIILLFLI